MKRRGFLKAVLALPATSLLPDLPAIMRAPRYEYVKYGLAVPAEGADSYARALARSLQITKEEVVATVYNRAFSTIAFPAWLGRELEAARHDAVV